MPTTIANDNHLKSVNIVKTAFLIFSLLICKTVLCQIQNTPVIRSTIDVITDERGKIKSIPGFALIKNQEYTFQICIEAPVEQHGRFLNHFSEILTSTYEKLKDEDEYQYARLYKYLWGDSVFNSIKDQINKLQIILKSSNPDSTLNASIDSFPLFLGKSFLQQNLFGNIFHTKCTLDNAQYTSPYYTDQVISTTKTVTDDTLKLEISVADIEKQFYRNFFNESRRLVESDLNAVKAKRFYVEIKSLNNYIKRLDSIQTVIRNNKGEYICDRSIYDRYQDIISSFEGDYFPFFRKSILDEIRSGWMSIWLQRWIWKMDGNIALNPLPFTDEYLLPLEVGYDTLKAKEYNEYRESALEQMKSSKTLNEAKINYNAYDSLLKQKGTGSEVFSYRPLNESLIRANEENKTKAQSINTAISSIKIPLIEEKAKDNFIYRYYDASDNLRGSNKNNNFTISNKINVIAVGYNIKQKERFSCKVSTEEVKNQSEAITQLNQGADAFTDLFTKASLLPGILSNFVLSFRKPNHVIPNRTILSDVVVVGFTHRVLKNKNYSLSFNKDEEGDYIVNLRDYRNNIVDRKNLSSKIEGLFASNNIDCEPLRDLFYYKVDTLLSKINLKFVYIKSGKIKETISLMADSILERIRLISREVYNARESYMKQAILKQIDSYKAIIKIITTPDFYTLPPKVYESRDSDPLIPQFRNELVAFEQEKKAAQKNIEIVLTNETTKKEFKIKDSYRTAPVQTITYSLGLAYIFNSFRRSEVTVQDNKISNSADEEQFRIIAGLHYHLKPVILADDRPIWKLKGEELKSRFSIFGGLSFPKPLYNLHIGVSGDIWTGIKLTTGFHFYRFTDYSMLNGQVIDQHSKYIYNGMFLSINIDPPTFVKFLSINFFK